MKARVKATGRVVEVTLHPNNGKKTMYVDTTNMNLYYEHELDFHDTLDYWTRLEHQYAGMAMQGIMSNPEINLDYEGNEGCILAVANTAYRFAHALVEKMKEERK